MASCGSGGYLPNNIDRYSGSLTAPPCAEIVSWFVRASPMAGEDKFVQKVYDAVQGITNGNGNNRATFQLGSRELRKVSVHLHVCSVSSQKKEV